MRLMRKRTIVALAATSAAALAIAGTASAHAKLDPYKAPAGSDLRLTLVIPSENPSSPTVKVAMKLPANVVSASFEAKPGWKRTVTVQKLAKPLVIDGAAVKSRISTVTWTATAGGIQPGEFATFSLLIGVPNKAGAKLAWPTVQTYRNGTSARWIGPADADQPAPMLTVEPSDPAAGS